MMYPLVVDLAAEGVAVVTTCRVLGFSTQVFYKWNAQPYSDLECADAHLLNEIVDLHADDPEFGCRFLHDELVAAGHHIGANRVHRLCRENEEWSVFAKKKGLSRKAGPPVHDDLVNGTSLPSSLMRCG
jgi:putative transposase